MAVDSALIQISTVPSVDSFVKLVTNSTEIKNESVKVKFLQKFLIFFSSFFLFENFCPKFFSNIFSSQ